MSSLVPCVPKYSAATRANLYPPQEGDMNEHTSDEQLPGMALDQAVVWVKWTDAQCVWTHFETQMIVYSDGETTVMICERSTEPEAWASAADRVIEAEYEFGDPRHEDMWCWIKGDGTEWSDGFSTRRNCMTDAKRDYIARNQMQDLRASLGADHMQMLEQCSGMYSSPHPQPAPAPREISQREAFERWLALGGLYTDEIETARDAFEAGWKAALETRAPQTALEREVQDLRRQMRWMHTSCEPDNCHTSGENCTGGARWTPEDFAPQTAPRDPYKRGQLLP